MKKIAFIITLLFISTTSLSAQQRKQFLGQIKISDYRYPINYSLDITVKNGKFTGYSITHLGTAEENKASVSGYIKGNKIYFKELKVIYTKTNAKDFCMMDVTGTIINKKGIETFTGTFTSYHNNDKTINCAGGSIAMANTASAQYPKPSPPKPKPAPTKPIPNTTKPTENNTPVKPADQPVVVNPKPVQNDAAIKMTHNARANFDALDGSIILNIWDDNEVDGDIVSIFLDGKIVKKDVKLTSNVYSIPLTINKNSELKIVSISVGSAPPNTGRINLVNNNESKNFKLYLEHNEQAVFRLIKK